MTMIILGTAGIASFEPHVSSAQYYRSWWALPWGTLTLNTRIFQQSGANADSILCLRAGNTIDLTVIAQTGLLGILLGWQ